jgi:hypothetical protein
MYGAGTYGAGTYGAPQGAAEAPPSGGESGSIGLRVTMVEAESGALPITVTMVEAESGALGLRVTIVEAESGALPVWVTILASLVASPQHWRPVVTLGGVDISERLTGVISVEAAEGEARVAQFSIAPPTGVLTLPDWTGQPVTIDIAAREPDGGATDSRRLFTGVVDVPDYDLSAYIVTFECTDQMQEILANTPRAWLDESIGGWYSEAVSGPPVDALEYATARLASVPASLDLDPYQQPRVTAWALPDTPDIVFDDSAVLDGSLSLKLASRADLINDVSTRFEYRFPRLRARVIGVEFSRTIDQYTSQALDIPSRAMIEQALSSLSGWSALGAINYVAIEPGVYESSGSGGSVFTVISATDAPNLALGFSASFYSRWVQSVTEAYALNIRAQASIDAVGAARTSLSGATLDAEFDDAAWLDSSTTSPVLTLPPSGDVSVDYGAAGATDRAAAQAAVSTLVAQARVVALSSHRTTRVSASTLLRADVDLDRRIEIDTPIVRASGKVSRVSHTLDMQAGSAVTDIEIAVSGFSAVGLDQGDDEPSAPSAPIDPTPAPGTSALVCECGMFVGQTETSPEYNGDTMIGFTTNAKAGAAFDSFAPAYPLAMSVGTPEIPANARDPITLDKLATYAVAIPQDLLEINVP